jgi:hypothetical protein
LEHFASQKFQQYGMASRCMHRAEHAAERPRVDPVIDLVDAVQEGAGVAGQQDIRLVTRQDVAGNQPFRQGAGVALDRRAADLAEGNAQRVALLRRQ